ncbi:MAG: VOC family protein [Cyanobacteria bacterium P01_C01_bin.38]
MQLDTVRIFVSDVNRSKPFYKDVLGLNLEADCSENRFLVFRTGSVTIVVENSEPSDETTGERKLLKLSKML